mgnify:CR=1 FL=1
MKIICIGRNYLDHAKEMNAPVPKKPMYFLKSDICIHRESQKFYYPEFTKNLHYECELVVKIIRLGKYIDKKFAHKYYSHISLGLDLTARDIQKVCKENGHPWEIAKSFDKSAPISDTWISLDKIDLKNLSFELFQNDTLKQSAKTKEMIFSIDEIISYVSQFMTLKIGDLIFTGTPSGVGPVEIGDVLVGKINGSKMFEFKIH